MKDHTYRLIRTAEVLLFFCICFVTAATLKVEHAPDEAMRYVIPQFIEKYHHLPTGLEPELIHPAWGFSYAVYPYLTSIISAFFMQIASFFSGGTASLLLAARLVSVLSGTASLFLFFKIGELLFDNKKSVVMLATFCGFLPQFLFLSSYQNNDSFAVFTVALIIYLWLKGLKNRWRLSTCIGLGISCGLCALSYYNAYVFLLTTILLFFMSLLTYKEKLAKILKKALLVFAAAFLVGGWFFIRNAVLHDGDFLGMRTIQESAEEHAQEDFKPSLKQTPASQGLSFADTFIHVYPGHQANWIFSTVCSFIGSFSYMTVRLSYLLYGLYVALFAIGFLLFFFLALRRSWWKDKIRRLLFLTLTLSILITLVLVMFNTYYSDYQAQGRYLMPALIPLMILITDGYGTALPTAAHEKTALRNRRTILFAVILVLYMLLFFISYFKYLVPGCLDFQT